MATFVPSAKDIKRDWFLLDGENIVIGRLATVAARLLIGKHKPTYTTFLDTGDHVIVVNAAKVAFTGRKLEGKLYRRHSGYMGGLTETKAKDVLATAYHLLGIDHEMTVTDKQDRPVPLLPYGEVIREALA